MTHPLPCPPPCPPDPWPMIGKAWQQMQAFRDMLWQVLQDMMLNDPQFTALLNGLIINALLTDPRITKLLQTMIDQGVINAITTNPDVINELKTLINQVVNEAIAASKMGVTDGSNALPGQIGEYVLISNSVNYAAYPAVTDVNFDLGTLNPGDWLCFVTAAPQTPVGTWAAYLDPAPAGFSNGMGVAAGAFSPSAPFETVSNLTGEPARASLSVATVIPFKFRVDQQADPALPAGVCLFWFQAWRMR